jgi:hypothetical protein
LNKLLNAGIIEKIRVGREVKYKLKDDWFVCFFLVDNNEALSNELIDRLFEDEKIIDFYLNRGIDAVLEFFPNPYYL